MARYARKKSESGIYHIMLRGINKQNIFEDAEDRQRLIGTIKQYKSVSKYEIYGYCLMGNHVHLLIGEKEEVLSTALKRICGSYVYWYNLKYERCGHLFQERYKSEVVGDDSYFLTVLRYIHQNPVKAGISHDVEDYIWSSYKEYIGKEEILDTDFALEMFSDDREKAIALFKGYMKEPNSDKCLDDELKIRLTDNEVQAYMFQLGLNSISDLEQMEKDRRDKIVKELKLMNGVTIRQLSRITGISKSVIDRA